MAGVRVLVAASEVAGFAKTGGLSDVCGALPKALAALGHEVRVVMPAYQPIEAMLHNGTNGIRAHPVTLRVPMGFGVVPAGVLQATLPGSDVPVYFVAEWHLFGGRKGVYGHGDDAHRFAFFGRAALARMEGHLAGRDWLVGEGLTLADIALVAYSRVAEEGGFDMAAYPNVRSWIGRVEAALRIV